MISFLMWLCTYFIFSTYEWLHVFISIYLIWTKVVIKFLCLYMAEIIFMTLELKKWIQALYFSKYQSKQTSFSYVNLLRCPFYFADVCVHSNFNQQGSIYRAGKSTGSVCVCVYVYCVHACTCVHTHVCAHSSLEATKDLK